MAMKTVSIQQEEYHDMIDYMERMKETIGVLSNRETVKKLKLALKRIESGEFLTKNDMVF